MVQQGPLLAPNMYSNRTIFKVALQSSTSQELWILRESVGKQTRPCLVDYQVDGLIA